MSDYKVDKGIPIPPKVGRKCYYPWEEMKPGDSFFVACDDENRSKVDKSLRSSVSRRGKQCNEEYTTRSVDGGIRVWKIK